MILVTSAAGGVGRPLVRSLRERGFDVRAFVKNDAQAQLARSDGAAEIVVGDLRNRADLEKALSGAKRVYHAAPTQLIDEVPVARALIEICAGGGVEHICFHSVIHPDIDALVHHHQKLLAERLLRDSGLPVAVLRPSHYMQNYLEFWEFILAGLMPYPVSPTSVMGMVDVEDVAEAAAAVLSAPDEHVGKTYDLSAQALDRDEMAQIWSRVLGHRVTALRLPPNAVDNPLAAAPALGAAVVRSLRNTKLNAVPHLVRGVLASSNARGIRSWPPEARSAYVRMMTYYDANGLPVGEMADLPKLLGRKPTSYENFARRVAVSRGVSR
ncbi:NmrA family protein [Segniliparus rotundus DSM 44985]|uniref:NmrA family protein n=1 Tax=Segniliparus rotundus (strain ATCC BAA-972 / CDC 1076 / CIP 108378 / DSM 44985 / JCM 13578) TaxID=640132 RepID=D6ZAL8_SEGRD|nr:NmrA family NAD(P)-binding protein [Segniliparus rotundus]ADG98754.1 NmrA family protein [Segniliparus rotundus DSM 44985]